MHDDPIIGREWAGYVVQSKIGEGGMGAVYLLVHTTLPDKYKALKILNAHGASLASAKERFEQEARVAAALGKNRVAEVVTVGQFDGGIPYIVMEYIPGRSLADHLEETGPLRVLTALQVAYGIADTLTVAHSKQIVHRDVKPSNIMLTRTRDDEFAVTILDWGIAKARGEFQVAHTATTAIAGTLGYMAPEVVRRGGSIDGRADVFSLGVLLYKVLSGVLPFPALTGEDQIPAFMASRPPSIGQNRSPGLDVVPQWIERIVLRALSPVREDRPTMDQLREELGHALRRVQQSPENNPSRPDPGTASSTPSVETPDPPHRSPKNEDATKLIAPGMRDAGTAQVAAQKTQLSRSSRYQPLWWILGLVVCASAIALWRSYSVSAPTLHSVDMAKPSFPDLANSAHKHIDAGVGPAATQTPQSGKPPVNPMPAAVKGPVKTGTVRPPPPPPPKKKAGCYRNATGSLVCPS